MAALCAASPLALQRPGARASPRAVAARAAPPRASAHERLSGALVGSAGLAAASAAGAARAHELDAGLTSVVQAAEAAVEQVAEAVKDSPVVAEAVAEAASALKDAEAAVAAATATDSGAVAEAVAEAATALKTATSAATSAGADVDLLAALAGASAAIQDATSAALEASGVDPAAVAATAAAGAATATTLAQKVFQFLSTTEPSVLAEDALGAIVVAYLTPPLARAAIDSARGYSGDVLPTSVLDTLASDGGAFLVDIRSAADKQANGVPDLPDNDKLVELEYVRLEAADDALRDPAAVCAESTAVQIAALRRLNAGRALYVMDEAGSGGAKAVAQQLRRRGFKKVFVLSGGAAAWSAAKLSKRPWSPSAALLPPRAASAAASNGAKAEVSTSA